ncbi:MAG: iron ABC transporter permease [Bacteroidota bacterium]
MIFEKKVEPKILILISLLILFIFLDVFLGSVKFSLKEFVSVLLDYEEQSHPKSLIIWSYRIPKMLTSLVAGMALPLSGLLMQTIFRNPLSGPFVLGISSGAGLGVAFTIMMSSAVGVSLPLIFSNINTVLAGTIGAGLVMAIILYVSERVRNLSTLLIVGVMIGSFSSAIIGVLQYFSTQQELKNYIIWTMGSLGSSEWSEILLLYTLLILSVLVVLWISKGLNAITIGENYAYTLGINVNVVRRITLIVASVLAGGVTAIVGPVAFIGLAVPHIAKSMLSTMDHGRLIPYTMLLGGVLMLFFDILTQFIIADQVIPINIITSLFGAPFVIAVVMRRSRKLSY